MNWLAYTFAALLILPALAQDPPKPPPLNANVSGIVKDSVSGSPLANYDVSTDVKTPNPGGGSSSKVVKSTTDEGGHYKLTDLPPGNYRIDARDSQHFGSQLTKRVSLAGHDLDHLDFRVLVNGTISGKVVDENKEPVPGMTVLLISKEYFQGSLGYFLKAAGRTNDRGDYKINRVEAGHPYLLVAENRVFKLPAHSDAPLNPKLRRRVPMRTWYLNSPSKEGAVAVTLRPGEDREAVDIEVKKSASYCVDGVLSKPDGPAALAFSIEAQQPSSGISSGGGMFMSPGGGVTGFDGKFRICDLYPGSYRLSAVEFGAGPHAPPPFYSVTTLTISDRDITGLKLAASTGVDLNGEIALEGQPPAQPVTAKISIYLAPRLRSSMGEDNGGRYQIPGTFTWKGVFIDDYVVRTVLNSPGLYVKDILYSDRSVMYEPLQLGNALGNAGLKVIVAQDGASLAVNVADKDGNPAPDCYVTLVPADLPSDAILAARMISGQSDHTGQYTSPTIAPGKYYVAASLDASNATEESISKISRSRNHFTEVILPPGGKVQLNLEPLP